MREILFRGKRVDNGGWIFWNMFGHITTQNGKQRPITEKTKRGVRFYTDIYSVKIRKETIGQYTGLTDKNGEKIFEGDIVQGEAEEARGVVEWQQAEGRYLVSVRNGYDWLCMDDDDWCVIVNIHDNPELLSRG